MGVIVSGAIGAAIGDQAFFYVFRGRLPRWVARYPALEQTTAPLLGRVRRHASLMVLLIRFAPGLRIALAAACAWVEVPSLKFSLLNLLSSFAWAIGLLMLVGWFGPVYLARFGVADGRARSSLAWSCWECSRCWARMNAGRWRVRSPADARRARRARRSACVLWIGSLNNSRR